MPHWLDQYASSGHEWQKVNSNGQQGFQRPFGVVETAFDTDGVYHEGRADINSWLELNISSRLSQIQFRRRILLAWTALQLSHVLLKARVVEADSLFSQGKVRMFHVPLASSSTEAILHASSNIIFIEDEYPDVDAAEFYKHTQNTGRVIDATKDLANAFIFPVSEGRLRILMVMAHQISDGMTNFYWQRHFLDLLNSSVAKLEAIINRAHSEEAIRQRLPLPQEALYPPVPGTKARQRWFWAINLVLRHIKKPQVPAFANPLRRSAPLATAQAMPSTYHRLLHYTVSPPINSFSASVNLDRSATRHLHRLCREAGTSIGAGTFVLVAMVMMAMYETQQPAVPLRQRCAFIGSFPINPRPFFDHHAEPDSLMLAFSDGVVLPFLPSSLNLDRRFRLLAKQAQRQLVRYQKRVKPQALHAANLRKILLDRNLGSASPARIVPMNYIGAIERLSTKLPLGVRHKYTRFNPQGSLSPRPNPTGATCGVSSLGRSMWQRGKYDVSPNACLEEGEDAFAADFARHFANVRAREGEFLVGVSGDEDGIGAVVSYDGCAMNETLVGEWVWRMENLLVEAASSRI